MDVTEVQERNQGPRMFDARRGEWFWIDNALIDELIERVPEKRRADALAVYTILARHADKNSVSFPRISYLQRKLGRSKNTVLDALKALARIGILKIESRYKADGSRLPNDYTLMDIGGGFTVRTTPVHRMNDKQEHPEQEDDEAKASSEDTLSVMPLEKYVTDKIYDRMKAEGMRLPQEEYKFHLGRAKDMIAKDSPTDEEIDQLPAAFSRHFTIKGKTDPVLALREIRRQHQRAEIMAENNGPPAWETPNPFGEKTIVDEEEHARMKAWHDEQGRKLQEAMKND